MDDVQQLGEMLRHYADSEAHKQQQHQAQSAVWAEQIEALYGQIEIADWAASKNTRLYTAADPGHETTSRRRNFFANGYEPAGTHQCACTRARGSEPTAAFASRRSLVSIGR